MKHSSLKMYVLSRFSFNMEYLLRTDVHVQVDYYMGSAIEIPKVHYSKVMVHLYEMLCEHLPTPNHENNHLFYVLLYAFYFIIIR